MQSSRSAATYICDRCLLRSSRLPGRRPISGPPRRPFHGSPRSPLPQDAAATSPVEAKEDDKVAAATEEKTEVEGALSRRLNELTEDELLSQGRRAGKVLEEAGFSDELRKRLEERIAGSAFKSDNAASISVANLPSSAGRGTADIAGAQPWTGTESIHDSTLRMLNDAHKPLRVENRGSSQSRSRAPPPRQSVDTRMKAALARASPGERLVNARDRTSLYALSNDPSMSEKEKAEMRRVLKERFQPHARPVPGTIQGLASLANERIEDAIARGQFRNIQRGKGVNVERDHVARSPFLDTTEYFMNKIIQKQDIVPPWIEKQQEVVKTADIFRKRLRSDWKRHAARVIASGGGTLEEQIRRAEEFAKAEALHNPGLKKDAENESEVAAESEPQIVVPLSATSTSVIDAPQDSNTTEPPLPPPTIYPFRDPAWTSLESAYHTLAITELNNLTRSYNLMAPELAKKPYYSLARELQACYREIAPLLPMEIKERAHRPPPKSIYNGWREPSGMGSIGARNVKVWDDKREKYGLKQLWRDLFA